MESSIASIPITNEQLEMFEKRADMLIMSVKWVAKPDLFNDSKKEVSSSTWRDSAISESLQEEESLIKIAHQISKDAMLLSPNINHTLLTIREGLKIAMHISKTYTKFSGLDQLIEQNSRGSLSEHQKTEFRSKYHTASAITIFAGAYYILWELLQYKQEELNAVKMEISVIPELSLQDPVRALDCMMFYYAAYIERSGLVRTDIDFVKLTILYFQAIVDEIIIRTKSLEYTEAYTAQNYKLEGSEFCLKGFELELSGNETSIEFNRVSFDSIVGNKEAKHDAKRLATRLLCYDMQEKKNPFFELGGLATVTMGYGEPGTGKSMLIAAVATMLKDYCDNLGYNFLFWPMPDTVVSTYQGGSAERMMNWMNPLRDATKIIYAPIDDAENNLEERSRQGVSAGVREVISVFLRNTEGAYAINRGNAVIQLFTNLPEQIDKAVLSRINMRSYIGGARTREDFLDQDYLWYNKYLELDEQFINQNPPSDYKWLSAQVDKGNFVNSNDFEYEVTDKTIKKIIDDLNHKTKVHEHDFFANLFYEVQKHFPFFTSRDIRNIERAVDSRILDFDLPDEWFEKPENFAMKDYETKKTMILDIMKSNLGKLSFADIRLRETLFYLDNMARIADADKERKINDLVNQYLLQEEAQKRFREIK